MNFTGIHSGPVAFLELNELIILFMSWVVAFGKLNLLFWVTDDLMTTTLDSFDKYQLFFLP